MVFTRVHVRVQYHETEMTLDPPAIVLCCVTMRRAKAKNGHMCLCACAYSRARHMHAHAHTCATYSNTRRGRTSTSTHSIRMLAHVSVRRRTQSTLARVACQARACAFGRHTVHTHSAHTQCTHTEHTHSAHTQCTHTVHARTHARTHIIHAVVAIMWCYLSEVNVGVWVCCAPGGGGVKVRECSCIVHVRCRVAFCVVGSPCYACVECVIRLACAYTCMCAGRARACMCM